jgi:hypothetical protein
MLLQSLPPTNQDGVCQHPGGIDNFQSFVEPPAGEISLLIRRDCGFSEREAGPSQVGSASLQRALGVVGGSILRGTAEDA